MMDPVTLLLAITATQALTRLTDAVAERLTMRGRMQATPAAATMPPGLEVADRESASTGRAARSQPRQRQRRRGRG